MKSNNSGKNTQFRALPSIEHLLVNSADSVKEYGRKEVTDAFREIIGEMRDQIAVGQSPDTDEDSIREAARKILSSRAAPGLRSVFNLTGTVLHTNLGRANLPDVAINSIAAVAAGYSNLEYDLEKGTRGNRETFIENLICELTGAEAATVVNNNAAAVLLVLNTLGMNKEVPVSRGELVEIGGSFRIPEVMQRANCSLVEVGATNRTHLKDFRAAINEKTALLMKVHTSNYKIEGFTKDVATTDLANLASEFSIPFVMDLGSGSLINFKSLGLPPESTVSEVLSTGVDIVTFSGDKLLGGPQSGLIAGRADLIEKIKANPLKRALRLDKMTLSGLEEVLKLYRSPDDLIQSLPTLRFLTRTPEKIRLQAERVAPAIALALGESFSVEVLETQSQVGSGSLPTKTIASIAIGIKSRNAQRDFSGDLAAAFRRLPTPVIGHINKRTLLLDLRCLEDEAGFLSQLEKLHI